LADFAHGFSLSERIITRTEEIYDLELMPPGEHGIEIHLHIAAAAFARLKQHRRTLAGPSGCGLCGTESLSAMDWHLPPITSDIQLSLPSLLAAAHSLQQRQVLNAATGALHAAAWVNPQGQILLLREDVGRHNALDKLIGALALLQKHTHTVREPGFVLLTSRASYELVQKAARANIPLLATISAPTSLAVRMAQQTGLTLLGFVREQRAVIYAHGQRVIMTGHAEGAEGAEGAESADDTYRA
jgi:FdhD protein